MNRSHFIRIGTFVLIVFSMDFLLGAMFKNLYTTTSEATSSKLNHVLYTGNEELVVLGSSRAESHFDPSVIENKTKLTCYNGGSGGQGLRFTYIELRMLLKRYQPKLVVVELSPNLFTVSKTQFQEKLKLLLPYVHQEKLIDSMVVESDPIEHLKLQSHTYPYNSMGVGLLSAKFSIYTEMKKGFFPLNGAMDTNTVQKSLAITYEANHVHEHLLTLKSILNLCQSKGVDLRLVISPIYKANADAQKIITELDELTTASGYTLSNYSSLFDNSGSKCFKDPLHLNKLGAQLFTETFSDDLNLILLKEKQ